ncbi:hypothetical protein BsWGS_03452 [Bradybaena similaris]
MVEFLVSLAVLCGTVFLTETHAHGSCEFIDVNYRDNETFFVTDGFGCAKLRCVDGTVTIVFRGCKVGESCYQESTTYIDQICKGYTCDRTSPFSRIYHLVHDKTYCLRDDGSCATPDNVWITNRFVNDRLQRNCRCTIVDGQEDYQCDPPRPWE